MSILSWIILIYLSRSGTIGQDEVEVLACTILLAVFKADEGWNLLSSCNHIIDLSMSWKDKNFFAGLSDGYWLRQPYDWHTIDFPHPLGYSRVK